MRFVQPSVLLNKVVEASRRLRACREILRVDLLQNPDQDVVTEIQKLSHDDSSARACRWRDQSGRGKQFDGSVRVDVVMYPHVNEVGLWPGLAGRRRR